MKVSNNISEMEMLAASQWGMFTVAQAKDLGVQRNQIARMLDKGRVESITHGVYRYTAGDETCSVDIKGAWMSVNPHVVVAERMKKRPFDAVVAGRTAAAMHGIGEFYASPYTFLVPARKQTTREDITYLMWEFDERDVVFVDALPATSIERTIADLVRLKEDPDLVGGAIADAAWQGHEFDTKRLAELLSPLAARNGFKKKDGETFARELLSNNAANVQISQAQKKLSNALSSFHTPGIVKTAETLAGLYASSEALRSINETTETLRQIAQSAGWWNRASINTPQLPASLTAALNDAIQKTSPATMAAYPGIEQTLVALKDALACINASETNPQILEEESDDESN